MKITRYVLFFILICLIVLLFSKEAEIKRVSNGVVDYSLANESVIGLYGDWEFYYNMSKDDINNLSKETKKVPEFWSNYEEGFDKYGYGTYKVKISGLEENEIYTVFVPTIGTSANIYINDKLAHTMGKFGKVESDYFPKFDIAYIDFMADAECSEIVIEVANYVYARSGLWLPLKLGTKEVMTDYRLMRTTMEGIVVGIALIMLAALFYLLAIIKDKLIAISLILASILTLIYQFTKGERLIILMFPDISMATIVKLQYMVLYLLPLCMLIFLIRMKGIKKIGIINKSLILISIVITIITIFLPVSIFTEFSHFGYFVTFSIITDVFFLCIFDAIRGDMKSRVVLYALLSIGVTTAHDLLITNNIIGGKMDILAMGFLIAIMIFSVLVITEIQKKFDKAALVDVYEQGYLNSQIKSHFIFNSLNSITNKIKTNADEAEELAVTFSAYLRDTIDWHNLSATIPFAKELEMTENYVFIQQNRFKDIEFTFEIEEDFDADIPPLTLQPLVENAVIHGLKPQKYKGVIKIKAYTIDDRKYLEVFNSGVGMDADTLDELRLKMSKEYKEHKLNDRIGILNINGRIKELTGDPLEINSSKKGVSIIIKL